MTKNRVATVGVVVPLVVVKDHLVRRVLSGLAVIPGVKQDRFAAPQLCGLRRLDLGSSHQKCSHTFRVVADDFLRCVVIEASIVAYTRSQADGMDSPGKRYFSVR